MYLDIIVYLHTQTSHNAFFYVLVIFQMPVTTICYISYDILIKMQNNPKLSTEQKCPKTSGKYCKIPA